jgi:hypothetical protein
MPTNPAPRAALSKADGGVARPPLRRRPGAATVPPVSTIPLPTPTDVVFGPVSDPPPAEVTEHKAKGKKGHKASHDKETVDVLVPLTKPLRRALKAAAADRETTPEALAALVLTAWLER